MNRDLETGFQVFWGRHKTRLNADNEISAIFQEQQVTGPHGETFDIVIRTNDRSIQLYIQREDLRQAIPLKMQIILMKHN